MEQPLDKLEVNVYQLAQKFETLVGENKRLTEEVQRLKDEQIKSDQQHEAAIDELSEALLVQVNKLKEDLQSKIDSLIFENQQYRDLLVQNADQIRAILARLPVES
ncbi:MULTISPECIES: hypothetical protein [Neisseria]|uniref:Uncharacterized protein n=1 Tax=Neisseria wadsworthii 9715 TaxID=1030841 RepID=G4CT93_9NEIS|nr:MULTISPECIES: hypothetical protein [Neisseria]EGZ44325.1 hypothetical protein HMPREF9370_2303 [Neisseria wadsworthii 9715]KPN72344.1 hypothetical protein AKG09_00335 [Neisseria sp. 83E34]QMT35888.1 hypothetical protein H3L96_01065 [Neisseria wadsworthii]